MREYVVSELDPGQVKALEDYLTSQGMGAGLEHLYWLPVPVLSDLQSAHAAACGPYVVALDVAEDSLRMELLVRARNALHCDCIAMADARQCAALIEHLHTLLQELEIAC